MSDPESVRFDEVMSEAAELWEKSSPEERARWERLSEACPYEFEVEPEQPAVEPGVESPKEMKP